MYPIGFTLLPFTIIGAILQIAIIYVILRQKLQFTSPFLYLTLVKSYNDFVYMAAQMLYYTPMVILSTQILVDNVHYGAFVVNLTYEIMINSHLVLTANRFLAVFTPILYKELFTNSKTKIYALAVFLVSASYLSIFSFILDCRVAYTPENYLLISDLYRPVCQWFFDNIDSWKNLTNVLLQFLANVIIVAKIQWVRKKKKPTNRSDVLRKKELNFLKQIFFQTFIYALGAMSYYLTPFLGTSDFVTFVFCFLEWAVIGMLEGFFTMFFISEIRNHVFRKIRKTQSASVETIF